MGVFLFLFFAFFFVLFFSKNSFWAGKVAQPIEGKAHKTAFKFLQSNLGNCAKCPAFDELSAAEPGCKQHKVPLRDRRTQ